MDNSNKVVSFWKYGAHTTWQIISLRIPSHSSMVAVGVHPHVALSATRGKASPSLKEIFFSHVLWQLLRPVFQPCLLAGFKEQMFLCFFLFFQCL